MYSVVHPHILSPFTRATVERQWMHDARMFHSFPRAALRPEALDGIVQESNTQAECFKRASLVFRIIERYASFPILPSYAKDICTILIDPVKLCMRPQCFCCTLSRCVKSSFHGRHPPFCAHLQIQSKRRLCPDDSV